MGIKISDSGIFMAGFYKGGVACGPYIEIYKSGLKCESFNFEGGINEVVFTYTDGRKMI